MKRTYLYLNISMFFICSSLVAYAQVEHTGTLQQIDMLTKVIGFALIVGGIFTGFMQMKMANKIAEVEAKFTSIIHLENEKQNDKLQSGLKELENKMATKHELAGLKQIIILQHENVQIRLENLQKEKTK